MKPPIIRTAPLTIRVNANPSASTTLADVLTPKEK